MAHNRSTRTARDTVVVSTRLRPDEHRQLVAAATLSHIPVARLLRAGARIVAREQLAAHQAPAGPVAA